MTTRRALVAQSVLLALAASPTWAKNETHSLHVGNPKIAQFQSVQAAVDALPESGGAIEKRLPFEQHGTVPGRGAC